MKRIEIFKSESTPFAVKPDPNDPDSSADAGRMRHPGGDDRPQVFDGRTGPNRQIAIHTHEKDEIIYIVSGQMIFGQHTLNPGDSVYVPGMTLYSFKAGPQGLEFLNFRPSKDVTSFRKDQFMKLQELKGEERDKYREEVLSAHRQRTGWE